MTTEREHAYSLDNRTAVEASKLCGCFYCLAIFPPALVTKWTWGDQTALCPICGIDSVLPSSEVQLDDYFEFRDLLTRMKAEWFDA